LKWKDGETNPGKGLQSVDVKIPGAFQYRDVQPSPDTRKLVFVPTQKFLSELVAEILPAEGFLGTEIQDLVRKKPGVTEESVGQKVREVIDAAVHAKMTYTASLGDDVEKRTQDSRALTEDSRWRFQDTLGKPKLRVTMNPGRRRSHQA
jgi:hypothetical protein